MEMFRGFAQDFLMLASVPKLRFGGIATATSPQARDDAPGGAKCGIIEICQGALPD